MFSNETVLSDQIIYVPKVGQPCLTNRSSLQATAESALLTKFNECDICFILWNRVTQKPNKRTITRMYWITVLQDPLNSK